MKKRTKDTIFIGTILILLSVFLHYLHYIIFKDLHHTLMFLVGDIAFIPLEVFFTTLVMDRLLEKREKEHLIEKLNMLVGVFYTEIGTRLLTQLVQADDNVDEFMKLSSLNNTSWDYEYFKEVKDFKNTYTYKVDLDKINLENLQNLLHESKDLLISLIANESLHDHETFTEMLMALMHLKEEMDTRYSLEIEEYEKEHIAEDLSVVYKYLTYVWFHYMYYLSKNYPSLFVKALINNPFDIRSKHEKDSIFLKQYKRKQ